MKKTKLSYREISSLCLEISMFLHAGSSAGAAFSYLAETEKNASLKKVYSSMGKSIDEGVSIYGAFLESGIFPAELCSLLGVAEKTGKYEETLMSLSKYYGRFDERDKQLRSAVLYPSILLLVMSAVIFLLLVFVLPVFAEVYASFGASLSGFSSFLLSLGAIIGKIWYIPVLLILLLLVLLVRFSVSESFRGRFFQLGKNRGLFARLAYARFAAALEMTLSSGLPLDEAVRCAGAVIGDNKKEEINKCADMLASSAPVYAAFSDTDILPLPEARLLALGVNGGGVDSAAEEIARRLDIDADDAMERAIGRIEPIMVIASSLIIGAILLSVMIPLINIMRAIG